MLIVDGYRLEVDINVVKLELSSLLVVFHSRVVSDAVNIIGIMLGRMKCRG